MYVYVLSILSLLHELGMFSLLFINLIAQLVLLCIYIICMCSIKLDYHYSVEYKIILVDT